MKHNRIFYFAFLFLALPTTVFAQTLPMHYPVPGGIAVIKLDSDTQPQMVKFQKRRILTREANHAWYAVVGLPLSLKPGEYSLTYKTSGHSHRIPFTVQPKDYETQYITIKDKRKVNPNKQDLERIGKESKIIRTALATWSEQSNVPFDFVLPVEGRLSSPFGLRRFFNGQPRKPHSGLDIAAAKGTPILAPAAGKIITTGDYFFNGNTIFIDHGQGLVTMFCHLNKIRVKPGQVVDQGQQLGEVGMTGRVTGPHLHWSVSLNNARIEPRLLLGPEYRTELSRPTGN